MRTLTQNTTWEEALGQLTALPPPLEELSAQNFLRSTRYRRNAMRLYLAIKARVDARGPHTIVRAFIDKSIAEAAGEAGSYRDGAFEFLAADLIGPGGEEIGVTVPPEDG